LSLRGQRIVKQRFAELTGIGYKNAYLFMLKTTNMIYADLTKTHNWAEWTAPSVSPSQTKANDINSNDRPQMQNENEIGRSLFPSIHGLRILLSFDYLHQSHAVKISLGCFWVDT